MRRFVTLLMALAFVACVAPMAAAADWVLDRDFSKTANPNGQWTYGVYLEDAFSEEAYPGGFYAWPGYADWPGSPTIGYLGNAGGNLGAGCVFYTNSDTAFGGPSQWWAPRKVMLHPASLGYAYAPVIRWTAPYDITISVDALFYGCEDETSTDVHVLLNGTMYDGTEATGWIPTFTNSLMDGAIDGNYGYEPLGVAPTGTSNNVAYSHELNLVAGDKLDFVVGYGSDVSYVTDLTGLDVTITEIPEPGCLVALATGLIGLVGLRRRK